MKCVSCASMSHLILLPVKQKRDELTKDPCGGVGAGQGIKRGLSHIFKAVPEQSWGSSFLVLSRSPGLLEQQKSTFARAWIRSR